MRALDIHHIGHAVADLDEAIATYERLFGSSVEHRETVPEQGVEAATMLVGADRVELLLPLGEDTPVGRFIDKRGPGMHHVAFEWAKLEAALSGGGGKVSFTAEDTTYYVDVSKVSYVRREAHVGRVGF
jgi:methylmalonyl-CoA epimerase